MGWAKDVQLSFYWILLSLDCRVATDTVPSEYKYELEHEITNMNNHSWIHKSSMTVWAETVLNHLNLNFGLPLEKCIHLDMYSNIGEKTYLYCEVMFTNKENTQMYRGSPVTWSGVFNPESHDDVIKWKHFQHFWPFVWVIHRSSVKSPHKGQWCRALMFSLICAWTNCWGNNQDTGDLRHHHAHYEATAMAIIEVLCVKKITL